MSMVKCSLFVETGRAPSLYAHNTQTGHAPSLQCKQLVCISLLLLNFVFGICNAASVIAGLTHNPERLDEVNPTDG